MTSAHSPPAPSLTATGARLPWLDGTKGISILWIALFHFFIAYGAGHYPWPIGISSFASFVQSCAPEATILLCRLEGLVAAVFQRGSQPVGVFVVLSGFGLTYALAEAGRPRQGWRAWYGRRFVRLFPMYWAAHVVYLISPFVYEHDPVDIRFLLSFMGDRVIPVETLFFYLNPAWWYFGLLLELYLVFPLLFILLRRVGPGAFFVLCALFTVLCRYVLQSVLQAHGYWSQGAFFGARLWEFAAGMSLAAFYHRSHERTEQALFSPVGLGCGVLLYVAGVYSYEPHFLYTASDGLIGTGLFMITAHAAIWILRIPLLRTWIPVVGAYSYGFFLLHQPYVMYCGRLLREHDVGFGLYVAVAVAVVATVCFLCILLEKEVNRMVSRLRNRWMTRPSPS